MADMHKPVVLVVTSRFPSINQSWIDTYLEQLLNHSFDIRIYSSNKNPKAYHPKVDRLALRRFVIDLDLKASSFLRALVKTALLHPGMLFHACIKAGKISKRLVKQYRLTRGLTFLKLMRSGLIDRDLDRADAIHAHGELLAFQAMLWALMRDIPFVLTFHGLLPGGMPPLPGDKRSAINGEVSRVLVNTRFAMHQAANLGCPKAKISILPQGLPLEDFVFAPRSCPGEKEVLHLLSIGRIDRDKGYGYSLIAAARLVKAGVNLQFHIVGEGPDKHWIQGIIDKLELSGHVTLYEAMSFDKLSGMYHQAHLFILASLGGQYNKWTETQGVVLQEAQASGCIPIATRVGGIPECVNHGQDAMLVSEKSSRAISEAVLYLLAHPEQWRFYQENGRKNVEQNFSAEVIGARMAEILREEAQSGRKVRLQPDSEYK
ncbi:MAG: glycosyltransferase family 4 protein [Desulfobacteraceae bacterium]|nr:glycosyltransferase family 4 protein [Desulfobacteraceae bacterium]MCF8112075.1 glycosyltransferase family 4 protein [Desulfobacteraceae bacterium]